VKQARKDGMNNFLLLSAHKVMPPVMDTIVKEGIRLDGFICPGHVATITGSGIFNFLPEKYKLGCVVAGFEPSDLLQSILMLIMQVNGKSPSVEIQYTRAVTLDGNSVALRNLSEVFELTDVSWRGFGIIPSSGLRLREEFENFDAEIRIPVNIPCSNENTSCICGDILRGLKKPFNCKLFRKGCTPENPVGACMVSSEGACNSFFNYNHNE
jgi:hydrogenase expression/formation protein HypD